MTTVNHFNLTPDESPVLPKTVPTLNDKITEIVEALHGLIQYPEGMTELEDKITEHLAEQITPQEAADMVNELCSMFVSSYDRVIWLAYSSGISDGIEFSKCQSQGKSPLC